VLVDSGTSGYEGDPLRGYARSTRAHSTVQIGEAEQSEVWGVFRMGRMARVRAREWSREGEAGFRFSGEVAPYALPRALHQRRVERLADGGWRVDDTVQGAAGERLRSYLHLAPGLEARLEDGAVLARGEGVAVRIELRGADRVRLARGERSPDQGWYLPRFGAAYPATVVVMEIDAHDGRGFGWTLRRCE
jgi:hypothetical protein